MVKSEKITADQAAVTSLQLAELAAEFAYEKKAEDVVIIDVRGVSSFTDFFVVATGRSDRQVKAVHDSIYAGVKERVAITPSRSEGVTEGQWVLMDYFDLMVHIFTPEMRDFYRIERLWGEGKLIEVKPPESQPAEAGS